jgi:hypothetical protein
VINGGSVAEAAADTLDRLVSRLGPVTVTGSATNGETFKGTFRVAGFGAPGRTAHALVVVGQLEGSITDKSNKTTQIRDNRVALPATPVSTSTGCGTLRFQVGPADVNLAGNTTVRLAAATLELSDQTTFLSVPPGLLCTIAGLLTASDPLSGVAAVLNQLLVTKA